MSNDDRKPQNVIKADLTDRLFFKDIAKESRAVQNLVRVEENNLSKALDMPSPVTDLCQDVFSSLYKLRPEVEAEAPQPQRQMIEQMMNLPEYKSLVGDTRSDELASALGLLKLAPSMVGQLEKVEAELEKQRKQREPGLDQNGNPVAGDDEGPEPSFDTLPEQMKASLRAGMREALKEAQEETEKAKEVFAAWGTEPGELKKLPLADRLKLVNQLSTAPKFQKITEFMGRFQTVRGAVEATTFSHGQDEIVDIELGADLSRILPAEFLKLQNSPLLFYKDFVDRNLMQFQMKGTEHLGRGPIIACWDVSPSMEYNGAHAWSKATILTLMDVCGKQKRAFGSVAFESKVVDMRYWGKGDKPSLKDKLEISEMGTTGGTDFMAPLRAAFELRNREAALKPADIVFITDGACHLTPEQYAWIEEQKLKTNVRFFGVGIGAGSVESIRPFCDDLVALDLRGTVYTMEDIKKLLGAVTAAG